MSTALLYPTRTTSETYSTFSTCSANDIQAYTSRLDWSTCIQSQDYGYLTFLIRVIYV